MADICPPLFFLSILKVVFHNYLTERMSSKTKVLTVRRDEIKFPSIFKVVFHNYLTDA